jgi:NADP-reducing hydrogenase subunit HndC
MSTLTPEERKKKQALAKRLMEQMQHHVLVCEGHCCKLRSEPQDVVEGFKQALIDTGMEEKVRISTTSCLHRCGDSCTVAVYPEGIWYQHVTNMSAQKIVREHFVNGNPLEEQMIYKYDGEKFVPKIQDK